MLEFAADIGIPARQVELASAQEVQVHSPCADGTFSMVFNSKLLSYIYLNRADFEKRLAALEALFGISYTLKFMSKQRPQDPLDYTVMGLEALWWVEDGQFEISRPDNWLWTAMILQPDHITGDMFQEALEKLRKKKDSPALDRLRFEIFHEGLCVQIMHIGPYSDEPATVEKMNAFARQNGYTMLPGKHHEIYLGDPRRTEPSRLKTVLRHPVIKE